MKIGKGLPKWALVTLWPTIKKTILHKHENVTKILKMKHRKNQLIYPMGLCAPWDDFFIHNKNQNIDNKIRWLWVEKFYSTH